MTGRFPKTNIWKQCKYEAAFKQIDQDGDDNISKQEYEDFMNFATNKIHQMMQAINK